jgi:hypothetical protein
MNRYKEINDLPLTPSLAKVGVGGSNPLARSNSINACDDNSPSHKRPKATTRRSRVGFQKLPRVGHHPPLILGSASLVALSAAAALSVAPVERCEVTAYTMIWHERVPIKHALTLRPSPLLPLEAGLDLAG